MKNIAIRIQTFIDHRLERAHVRFMSALVVLLSLALTAFNFTTQQDNQTRFGPPLGADFAGFYTAGLMLHQYPATQLYNFELQDELYHQLLPRFDPDEKLPFVHPPFVAAAFYFIAWIPYPWVFGLWLMVSSGLYGAGLRFVWNTHENLPKEDWPMVALLAFSFEPFVMECWNGGQLSAVGFFCVSLAYSLLQRNRPIAAGLALGICLYKPTLLVLLFPMQLFARQYRVLLGFTISMLTLFTISLLLVGREGCIEYFDKLLGFAQTTSGTSLRLRSWKYVDLSSFLRLLTGPDQRSLQTALWLALAGPAFAFLAWMWWRIDRLARTDIRLLWASTIAGTLIINLYVGVYDTILVVLSALIIADSFRQPAGDKQPYSPGFRYLLLALMVVPWFTQPLAKATNLQAYTIVLSAFTLYPLLQIAKGRRQDLAIRLIQ